MTKNPYFDTLYHKFATPLSHFIAKRIGSDEKVTEEIFEETMVAAWKGFATFRHKSSYFTWLCKISLNKIADYYHDQVNKKSKLIVPLIEAIAKTDDKSLSPEENLTLKELRKSVNDCLDLLPPQKRKLLQFRYWYNLSYGEISKLMGISERAVEGQIYRAKHEFAEVWTRKDIP